MIYSRNSGIENMLQMLQPAAIYEGNHQKWIFDKTPILN